LIEKLKLQITKESGIIKEEIRYWCQTYTLDRPDGYDIHPSFLLLSAA
jgi:hypothetical protein